MKKMRLSALLMAVLMTASVLVSFSGCADTVNEAENDVARTIYVSPKGDDQNGDGSAASPFASIQRAKEFVRSIKKSGGDIVVELADGFYPLSETVVFDERDSGSKDARVIYRAAEGAKPILSGGKKFNGTWEIADEVN